MRESVIEPGVDVCEDGGGGYPVELVGYEADVGERGGGKEGEDVEEEFRGQGCECWHGFFWGMG